MLASAEGKLDIVELLLQYGADPNLQNPVRVFGYLLISEIIIIRLFMFGGRITGPH